MKNNCAAPSTESKPEGYPALFAGFAKALGRSPKAQAYCQSRGLGYTRLEAGYNPAIDYYKLKYCLIFPLKDKGGNIVSFYGRNTSTELSGKHYYTANRRGLYPGYPKPETQTLILTEAIIDAATLLQMKELKNEGMKEYEILACYGTNGCTDEHRQAIKELKELKEIIFFFDGDQAGKEGIQRNADTLQQLRPTVTITCTETPKGEDINSLLATHTPEIFTHLIENRKPFFSLTETVSLSLSKEKTPGSPTPTNNQPAPITFGETAFGPVTFGETTFGSVGTLAHQHIDKLNIGKLETTNPYNLSYIGLAARYHVRGGLRPQLDSLRVSLHITVKTQGIA